VHSPTFLTAAEYRGRHRLIHVDLYRHADTLPDPDWLAELLEGDGIAVVEWFERLGSEAPPRAVVVRIDYGRAEDERILEISAAADLTAGLSAAEVP
jgi:tRNA threonylcarbamoyladenosine biosynthesis protein TsaE